MTACAGPWRTSGAWWEEATKEPGTAGGAWDRDEWDVALTDGSMYRMYLDHTAKSWFIDGVVD